MSLKSNKENKPILGFKSGFLLRHGRRAKVIVNLWTWGVGMSVSDKCV